jgi:hypothetical protein
MRSAEPRQVVDELKRAQGAQIPVIVGFRHGERLWSDDTDLLWILADGGEIEGELVMATSSLVTRGVKLERQLKARLRGSRSVFTRQPVPGKRSSPPLARSQLVS